MAILSPREYNLADSLDIMTDIPLIDESDMPSGVSFSSEAIQSIRRISLVLECHPIFCDKIGKFEPYLISGLDSLFEQKFATCIVNGLQLQSLTNYIVTSETVICHCNGLFSAVFRWALDTLPPRDDIKYLLNNYPITLLEQICKIPCNYVHLIGESVKRFITLRKMYPNLLPHELYNVIEGNVPLTGSSNSPLTTVELNAIYRYLETKKSIYVHILLNIGIELSRHIRYLTKYRLEEDDIVDMGKSAWLFLFFSGAVISDQQNMEIPQLDKLISGLSFNETENFESNKVVDIMDMSEFFPSSLGKSNNEKILDWAHDEDVVIF